jgi:hypothetical protein
MTFTSRVRAGGERSLLWAALMPIRIVIEGIAYLLKRLIAPAINRDEAAAQVIAESSVGRAADTLASRSYAAWATSEARRRMTEAFRPISESSARERLRLGGVVALAASVTALVLRFAAAPAAPLTWIVPTIAAVCGALVMIASSTE